MDIAMKPNSYSIDFELMQVKSDAIFSSKFGFKVKDYTLASKIVQDMTEKLYKGKLLGSGFPFEMPYKIPKIVVNEDGTIIYDQAYAWKGIEMI